jgi:hypothetical protein
MKSTLLITFAGRKSGKMYTTPIVYLREGAALLMTTDSPWWKNLRGAGRAAPLALRVAGRNCAGVAVRASQRPVLAWTARG